MKTSALIAALLFSLPALADPAAADCAPAEAALAAHIGKPYRSALAAAQALGLQHFPSHKPRPVPFIDEQGRRVFLFQHPAGAYWLDLTIGKNGRLMRADCRPD